MLAADGADPGQAALDAVKTAFDLVATNRPVPSPRQLAQAYGERAFLLRKMAQEDGRTEAPGQSVPVKPLSPRQLAAKYARPLAESEAERRIRQMTTTGGAR